MGDVGAFVDLIEALSQFGLGLFPRAANGHKLGDPLAGGQIGAKIEFQAPARLPRLVMLPRINQPSLPQFALSLPVAISKFMISFFM